MKTIRSMLKHLFLAVPLMLIVSCNSSPPSTLIPHRCENGKFGYVDEKGKEWIEGKYDYAEEFSEDLAVVQVGRYFGYIDRKGEIVIPLQYTQAAYFLQGRALVAKEELYGFIDKENREIIPCIYERITPFASHEAYAVKNGKTGIIDTEGKVLVPFEYDKIEQLKSGLFVVNQAGREGFLNAQKQMILPCQYGYYTIEDKEGKPLIVLRTKDDTPYYRISYNSRYGLMDFEGNVLTPCKYEKIGAFTDGNLAHVILNDKVGYIDSNGKEVIPPIYDYSRTLPGNRYALYKDGLCYLVDNRTGKQVTSQVYNKIEQYRDNLLKVSLDGKYGMIDPDGNIVLEPIYDEMYVYDDWLKLYIKGSGKDGFAGRATVEEAKLVIPCDRYVRIESFNLGGGQYAEAVKAVAKYTYRNGVVNRQGKEVVPCQYIHIYMIENGKCLVMESGTNQRKWVKLNE